MCWAVECAVSAKLQMALFLWAVTLAGHATAAKPPSAPLAPNVMALEGVMPDLSSTLRLMNGIDNVAQYLSDPNTVCTVFIPTNEANTISIQRLGRYVGLAAQNETLQNDTYNYHIIPGRALTAADLMDIDQVVTREGETLDIWHKGGKPYLYYRVEYPTALNKTNIKAGKCLVHTLNMPLVPPSAIPMVQSWLIELGTMPTYPPNNTWAPVRNQFQAELAKATEIRQSGAANGSRVQTEASTNPASNDKKPATSSAGQGLGGLRLSNASLWVLQGCIAAAIMLIGL